MNLSKLQNLRAPVPFFHGELFICIKKCRLSQPSPSQLRLMNYANLIGYMDILIGLIQTVIKT